MLRNKVDACLLLLFSVKQTIVCGSVTWASFACIIVPEVVIIKVQQVHHH